MCGRVRAASVTVPTSLHHRVASDLIDAGIHVFIEKPLATDARESEQIAKAVNFGLLYGMGLALMLILTPRQP